MLFSTGTPWALRALHTAVMLGPHILKGEDSSYSCPRAARRIFATHLSTMAVCVSLILPSLVFNVKNRREVFSLTADLCIYILTSYNILSWLSGDARTRAYCGTFSYVALSHVLFSMFATLKRDEVLLFSTHTRLLCLGMSVSLPAAAVFLLPAPPPNAFALLFLLSAGDCLAVFARLVSAVLAYLSVQYEKACGML